MQPELWSLIWRVSTMFIFLVSVSSKSIQSVKFCGSVVVQQISILLSVKVVLELEITDKLGITYGVHRSGLCWRSPLVAIGDIQKPTGPPRSEVPIRPKTNEPEKRNNESSESVICWRL